MSAILVRNEKEKPFTAKIVDDLLNFANEKYGLNFDESDTPKAVYVVADHVVMVFEKRNQIYFESVEENEEFEIMKGMRELFRFLPDEKIYFGIMEIEENWQYCEHNYVERKKDELELRKQIPLHSLGLTEEELDKKYP